MTATLSRETAPAKTPAASPAKKSLFKSKKFIIVVIAVFAVAGGAYKFLAPVKPVPPSGGEIVSLDPATLNLAQGHYLKIAIAIQLLKGKGTAETFQSSQAAELVIDQFSNRSVPSLSSNAARTELVKELDTRISKAYPDEVYKTFLTQFVTQ